MIKLLLVYILIQEEFYAVIISENKGIKTLLAFRDYSAKARKLNHSQSPKDYAEACQEVIDLVEQDLSNYGDIYNSAQKSVEKRNTIAITIEDKKLLLQLVDIPKRK